MIEIHMSLYHNLSMCYSSKVIKVVLFLLHVCKGDSVCTVLVLGLCYDHDLL